MEEGFLVHTESSTSILLAKNVENGQPNVFLNPVQQYNRDLSIVAIRVWSQQRAQEKAEVFAKINSSRKAKKAAQKKKDDQDVHEDGEPAHKKRKVDDAERGPYKFTCLEALSATGLRAIRYAKEIPLLRYVIANDLSSSAVKDIERNIEYNDLTPKGLPESPDEQAKMPKIDRENATKGKVRPNEGDAVTFMYSKRAENARFDCIDLDPYGSATPFLDAAIGAVADGGLLCVTCTDMGVLAGHNYPEKAFTHYGGVCANAEYSHEVGLRLVLNAIASTAARYGRYIEPQLTLSIDFYCRMFVRVYTGPKQVKDLASKTALVYYCYDCKAHYPQMLGRRVDKVNEVNGQVNSKYHAPGGPPVSSSECPHCSGRFHIAGPMWMGPLHSKSFCDAMLEEVRTNGDLFGTKTRIEGMVSIARSELEDSPFYFTPHRLASRFNAEVPSLPTIASAILNGGYELSRSHASAGSIKTNAPQEFLHDIMREWIKVHPVRTDRLKPGSLPARIHERQQKFEVSLKKHPEVEQKLLSKIKLVMYQENPAANWGPARAAVKGVGKVKPAKKEQDANEAARPADESISTA